MQFPRSVMMWIGGAVTLGLALTAYSLSRYPIGGAPETLGLILALALLMALCDRFGLHLASGEIIHVDTIPLFMSVLVLNPAQALLVAFGGRVIGRIAGKRVPVPWPEHVFNVSQTLIYVGISGLALDLFSGRPWQPQGWQSWAGAGAVVVLMYALNLALVAGVVALAQRQTILSILRRASFVNIWSQGIMFGFGLLVALVVVPYPWALVLAVLPGVALFMALDRSLRAEKKQKELAEQNAALVKDLSEQAKQLREAHAVLQGAIDAKTQMIQNVSHELRTPLTAICGYTEALQEGLCGPLAAQQIEALQVIHGSSQQMIRLVNDLLTLQDLERGQLELCPVSVPALLNQVAAAFGQRALAAGIAIRVECDGCIPELHADQMRLEQALDNLADNAIKFSPDGGDLTLRAVALDCEAVEISVEDHGIGIPREALSRIYRRFYQVNGSSSRRFRGQGLGLAIVRRIVEIHGGSIRVESEVGKGTTFIISLPVNVPIPETWPVDVE